MEVILLDDIDTLGLRGEVVNVARGYARNFLLPRRLAEPATPAKVAELRKREEQRARHEAHTADQAQQIADVLGKTVLRFEVKAGPTGSLFGSVTPTNIADELWRTKKIRVDRRKIGIETIKRIGRHEVPIELFQDVHATVNTEVVPEGGELPSDEELAAMEAQERGEPETPAAEGGEPTLDEAPAAEAPPVEAPALEELTVEEPEPTGPTSGQADEPTDESEPAADGEAEIEHAIEHPEQPAPETTEETA
jgi:large subunit ribosomal protein L9